LSPPLRLGRCAQYRPETFEDLAYRQACGKLVSQLGYPAQVLTFEYDCHYMVRGLAVDKARGNVLKMDRHKYVKLAFHGFKELSRAERLATYADAAVRESYDEPDYALLDTLFSLGETYLFCQLVELRDAQPHLFQGRSYASMHADVRAAVDMCHRDGSLKRVVAADPEKYIYPDPALVPLLDMLRSSGKCVWRRCMRGAVRLPVSACVLSRKQTRVGSLVRVCFSSALTGRRSW
jgi:HAD superfamily 5'-nucleotidase-like hydrolase